MSAPQFTPGPHEAEPSEHLGAHAYAIRASDGDFLAVGCTLWDAYLFAAAPELYGLVEQFERVAEYELNKLKKEKPEDDEGARLRQLNLNLIRAALAKARGADK